MRVLLVEDERSVLAYLKRGLEENGYAVETAVTGREAIDWMEAANFDLIILDLLLPEIDGLTVCRELRQRGARVPILMLTARDTVDDRVAGLDAGADDYLVKPFAFRELVARLRALSRRAGEIPRSTVLQVADLTLDTATRQVRRGGRFIQLTAKEYAVLECLMRQPRYVLTRAMIVEQVWSHESYMQSNIVDVYVRNLRRKIDDPFDVKLIQTVRGSGYRLAVEDGTA